MADAEAHAGDAVGRGETTLGLGIEGATVELGFEVTGSEDDD